jgi:hypothetical protein
MVTQVHVIAHEESTLYLPGVWDETREPGERFTPIGEPTDHDTAVSASNKYMEENPEVACMSIRALKEGEDILWRHVWRGLLIKPCKMPDGANAVMYVPFGELTDNDTAFKNARKEAEARPNEIGGFYIMRDGDDRLPPLNQPIPTRLIPVVGLKQNFL